jgi:hypothetical protein
MFEGHSLMAEILNLNQLRKRKRRVEDRETAKKNRVKFGQTKSERAAAKMAEAARNRKLDGKKAAYPSKD